MRETVQFILIIFIAAALGYTAGRVGGYLTIKMCQEVVEAVEDSYR